jgi:hypothetical protein
MEITTCMPWVCLPGGSSEHACVTFLKKSPKTIGDYLRHSGGEEFGFDAKTQGPIIALTIRF